MARPDAWTDSSQPLGWIPTTATPRPVTSTTPSQHRSAANMSHFCRHGNATHDDDGAAPARSVNTDWSLSTGVRLPVGDQGPSPRGTQPRPGTGTWWYFLPSVGAGVRGYRYIPSSPDSQPQSEAPAWLLEMLETLNHDDMVSSKSASHETESRKLSGGSLVTSQSDIEPRSHPDPPAHDNMTVSTDDKVSDPGWGIKVTTDGLELKFETQLKGLIRWLALVAWPVILFSLLCNIVLVLALLILVCSCCLNRKKYRKLKKKFYIRLPPPQLLPDHRSFMPPPTTGQDQKSSGSTRATM